MVYSTYWRKSWIEWNNTKNFLFVDFIIFMSCSYLGQLHNIILYPTNCIMKAIWSSERNFFRGQINLWKKYFFGKIIRQNNKLYYYRWNETRSMFYKIFILNPARHINRPVRGYLCVFLWCRFSREEPQCWPYPSPDLTLYS